MMTVTGKRLRRLRLNRDLTQEELAEYLGMKSYTTVGKWENGDNLPRGKELKELAELYNVSADYILGIVRADHNEDEAALLYSRLSPERKKMVYQYMLRMLENQ